MLRIILLIYNLLLPFGLLVLLPASVLKMRKRGGYGTRFWQRFGKFDAGTRARLEAGRGRAWWLHAVSVGEVNVARKIIAGRLRLAPGMPVVLSVTTSTGYAVAVKDAPEELTVIYSPVDLLPVPGMLLDLIRPVVLVLVEAEVWPNLVRGAVRRGIPVVLANARLSPRSERRYRALRWLAAPVFGQLRRVLVQDETDRPRWEGIGVPADRIACTGSVKYDLAGLPQESRVAVFRELVDSLWGEGRQMVLAASTHDGEEAAMAVALSEVLRDRPGVRLAVAPRHAERREDVRAALEKAGISCVLRSGLPLPVPGDAHSAVPVLVIDSTGELRDWQALASLVIIGKSFLAEGGQNPAEAIAAGVPVVCGPHMDNFLPLMKLLEAARGIRQVRGLDELAPVIAGMLDDPAGARAEADRGRAALAKHRGATGKTVAAITAEANGL